MRHISFGDIFNYLSLKEYPSEINGNGPKANFRRQCKPFTIEDQKLYHTGKLRKVS